MKLLLQFVSFVSLLSTVKTQALYDCDTGCSLDANIMGSPVCGEDNLTYLNECLAFCQNIPVISSGVCPGEDPFQESMTSTDPQIIPLETMMRFEDYRFVGKITSTSSMEEDIRYLYEQQIFEETEDDTFDEIGDLSVPNYRITPEGYEYKTTALFDESAFVESVAPEMGFLGEGGLDDEEGAVRQRRTVVIGEDTRSVVPVSDVTRYPFRTIGQSDFGWGEGGCTLTMISKTSALTAAHCVWNINTKMPLNMTAIAPARYRDLSVRDGTAEPFGTWQVDYVSMFGQYQQFGQSNFDIAVVTYKPRIRNNPNCRELYPGDVVGHVGLDRAAESGGRVVDNRLPTMIITGYPADFLRGEMVTSGLCDPVPISRRANYINHFCDTFGGNSGSAVLVGNIALGVHAHGIQTLNLPSSNGAPMMTTRLYTSIYEWAGHGTGQTLCSFPRNTEVQPTITQAVPAPVPQPILPPVTQPPVQAPSPPVRQPTPLWRPTTVALLSPFAQQRQPTPEVIPTAVVPPIAPLPTPLAQQVPTPEVIPTAVVPPIAPLPTPLAQQVPTPEVIPTPVARPTPVGVQQPVSVPSNQAQGKSGKQKKEKKKRESSSSGKGGKKRRLR